MNSAKTFRMQTTFRTKLRDTFCIRTLNRTFSRCINIVFYICAISCLIYLLKIYFLHACLLTCCLLKRAGQHSIVCFTEGCSSTSSLSLMEGLAHWLIHMCCICGPLLHFVFKQWKICKTYMSTESVLVFFRLKKESLSTHGITIFSDDTWGICTSNRHYVHIRTFWLWSFWVFCVSDEYTHAPFDYYAALALAWYNYFSFYAEWKFLDGPYFSAFPCITRVLRMHAPCTSCIALAGN